MELGESAVASCPVFQLPRVSGVSAAIEKEGRRAQWGWGLQAESERDTEQG